MWMPGASQMPPSTKLCIDIILALLCQGRLCQAPVYRIQVPSQVTAHQGLCVLLPCNFTAQFNSSGVAYKYWFLMDDDRDTSPAVATTDPGRALREPGGRIRLVGDAPDDCSLRISDVRAGDRARYYFRFVKGDFKYSYLVTQPLVDVTELTEQPVLGVPEVLLSGQLVNVTCQAPGTCSGTPPQITWTGGFDYTARNISVALANGSISYSSELSFTPAPGDHGKELVCTVTYPALVGVFTRRSVRLQVHYPPELLPRGNCTVRGHGPGGAAMCHCTAEGNPPPRLEWRLPNRTLPGDFEGPELRATSWARGLAVSGELRGPAGALANVSCAATNAHGQSQAALPILPAGRLCQAPVYRIQVPSRVTAHQGLCVLLPCNFTANFNSSGVAYKYWFLRDDDMDTSPAVATTDPGRTLREPGGRIRLVGDAPDDCSLRISDVRAGDRHRYYFRFVKGDFKYSYVVTQPLVDVTELSEKPVLGVPEVLLSGQLVNVTCQAPGTCSETPPQITWTGGFDYTARNVSVALANGSVSYSSELSFTPAPGDHGKELVCTVTYPALVGVFTRRSVRLQVHYPPELLPWGNCTVRGHRPGGAATCHCAAEGNPPPRLEWRLPNRTLPGDLEGPELRATSWARGPAVSGELRGPAGALANVSCAATNAHGQSQAALPILPAAGFSRTLVVALAAGGSLVLVVAGAAVAWKVVKGRQGGWVPARAGRCQRTGDRQVCHSYEHPASSVPSHRQDVTGEGGALEKKGRGGRGGGGGRCYREIGDGEQFTEENIYAKI